jgi:two-component system cell cycle sensor histidine kinase/response regulator CckA
VRIKSGRSSDPDLEREDWLKDGQKTRSGMIHPPCSMFKVPMILRINNRGFTSARFMITLSGCLFFFLLLAAPGLSQANQKPNKTVLAIHSYDRSYIWERSLEDAIDEKLRKNQVEVFHERLDTRRINNPALRAHFYNYLKNKYKDTKLDLLLCTDNAAFSFLTTYGEWLFGNTPVVFGGVNHDQPGQLQSFKHFTGISEETDIESTLDAAFKLFPSTKLVVVYGAWNPSFYSTVISIKKYMQKLGPDIKPQLTYDLRLPEILKHIKKLPSDSIILLASPVRDAYGRFTPMQVLSDLFSEECNVPIFTIWDFVLGHGVIGGKLIDTKEHGIHTANLALKVLNLPPGSPLPPVTKGPTKFMFDYKELARFKLDLGRLPQGSIVINKPPTIWAQHQDKIVAVGILISLLVVVILFLIASVMRKRRVEAALRRSESFLTSMLNAIPIPVYFKDMNGKYIRFNTLFQEFFGRKSGDLIGKTIEDLPLLDKTDLFTQMDELVIKSGELHRFETSMYNLDGDYKHFINSKSLIRDINGDPLGIAGMFIDITEHKQTEEALSENQRRLQVLFDQASVAIYLIRADGQIIQANRQACLDTMYSQDQLCKMNMLDIDAKISDKKLLIKNVAKMEVGKPLYLESLHKRRDGSIFPVEIGVSIIISGNESQVLVMAGNISQRKMAEAALAESEARYRQIFNETPVSMFMQDFSKAKTAMDQLVESGVTDMKSYLEQNPEELERLLKLVNFVFVNQAALDLYEAEDKAEMLKGLYNVAPEKGSRHFIEQLLALYGGESEYSGMGQNRTCHGKTIDILVKKVVVAGYEHDLSQVLTTIVDLTEIKQAQMEKENLEKQLRQAQKMEAVGTLAGGIAHDFNNILSTIMGYADLSFLKGEMSDKHTECMEQILQATERARDLVKQLLTFSRRSETELKPVDINELVVRSVSMLEHTLPKMVNIQMKLAGGLALVIGDATQLEQVVMNLANNASDAMPEGGELCFSTENLDLGPSFIDRQLDMKPGKYVLLKVRDTGFGMDQETQEQIFDPFFTTKGIGKGTGLGLSTVYGIVKEHQGFISCQSEQGQGTAFKIYLPALDGECQLPQKDATKVEKITGGEETILLVDDEPAISLLGSEVLGSAGYEVITASSGEEALELIKRPGHKVNLIILDLGMPGMGGHKCLAEILAFDPESKVLIASGYSAEGKVGDTINLGARGFLAKPFRQEALLHTIRKVLDE